MIDANSNDSDDEGFVSNQIRIDEQNVKPVEKQQTLFKEFQPHYIVAEGLIRKEIPQSITSFANIPNKPRIFANKDIPSSNSEHPPTAKELFMNTKYYSLIYKRYKQPFGSEIKATFQHPINLLCCQNYKQDNFKALKDWDQLSMSQQPYSENCLIFDSRFEGGNLLCAFRAKKEANTYILFMQNDTNTYGYNQWFYFSIRNMKPNTKYTFRIANFKKRYSFFQNGMQPLLFSLRKAQSNGNGWYRDGFDIFYYPSQFKEQECTPYYTAEFSLQFEQQNDYVTISPNAPYSYSKLISRLKQLQTVAINNSLSWKLKAIAKTISFNQVPYLIISNKKIKKASKKKVVIFARQHPGETWSSYLVDSLIQRLVEQKSIESKWLLQQYDFHIVPMVNVDGVIYGNFRCDLAGSDLNRTWKNPIQKIQPQIYQIKKQISKLSEKYEIQLCLDLHTHSRQYGAFAYCCVDSEECRELPQIISACSPLFRYKACTFGISGDKKYTARAAVFGLTNSMHTITVELSCYGFKLNSRKYPIPFVPTHMSSISKGILQGFHAYKKRIEPLIGDEEFIFGDESEAESVSLSEVKSEMEQEQKPVSQSDSQPQIDQIQLQIKISTIFPASFIEDIAQAAKTSKIPHFNQTKSKINKVKKLNQSINRNKISNKFSIRKHESEHRAQETAVQKTLDIIETKTIELERVAPAAIRTKRQTNIPSQHSYKKQSTFTSEKSHKISADRPTKPVNLVQFSLKKLPLSVPQKIVQNHHILLDEGIPSIAAYSYGKRQDNRFDKTFSTYEAMCRPRVRLQSKKIGIVREDSRLEQELPFLCIMSETKKQVQMEKIKERHEGKQAERRNQSQKHHYSGLNPPARLFETPVAKNNWPKNIQMIEKIGSDHFTRYAESTFFRRN